MKVEKVPGARRGDTLVFADLPKSGVIEVVVGLRVDLERLRIEQGGTYSLGLPDGIEITFAERVR